MKPAPFELHRPRTLEEALEPFAEHGDEARPLAGGQSLVPMLALRLARYAHLVDLNGVTELSTLDDRDGSARIGAGVRHRRLESDPLATSAVPLLARAAAHVGHVAIRNRGTFGGSLAHADPAAEYPAVALALDATMEVRGPNGSREVAAADFFTGTWTTALDDDEILVAARFPGAGAGAGWAIEEVARRHGDFALAGAAVGIWMDDGRVQRAAIAMFGVDAVPRRATAAEAALVGTGGSEPLREIAGMAVEGLEPLDDLHASGQLRTELAAVTVERALVRAREEARNA